MAGGSASQQSGSGSKIAPYLMILPALAYLGDLLRGAVLLAVPDVAVDHRRLGLPADADVRWDFGNYTDAFSLYREQIFRSFGYALAATVLCLVLAYPAGLRHRLQGGPVQEPAARPGDPAVLRHVPDPHASPGRRSWPTTAGWSSALGTIGLLPERGPAAVDELGGDRRPDLQLDHAFMILPLYVSLEKIDPRLLEASTRPLRQPAAGVPQGDPAAVDAGRARRQPARVHPRRSATSSTPTTWAARRPR